MTKIARVPSIAANKIKSFSSPGFTFIELLVVSAITGILISVCYSVFIVQKRIYAFQDQETDAQQNARVALEELTRTIAAIGVNVREDQVKILVAQPYQIVFNADLIEGPNNTPDNNAIDAGSPTPGASANDPYLAVPGSYASATPYLPAETWRYTLDGDNDGDVDVNDKKSGESYCLYMEENGAAPNELALMIGNPRTGTPMFQYFGDFDVAGNLTLVDHVDNSYARVAAGTPLDEMIKRIDITIVAETEYDPKYPQNGGYRQTIFRTSVTPRNLP